MFLDFVLVPTYPGVEDLHLAVASVHHVLDPVQGEGGLRDVGRHHALQEHVRGLLEDLGLEVGGQLGVDREDG